MSDDHATLLDKIMQVRAAQTAYFASKNGKRYGDRKLLTISKTLEAELDVLVQHQSDQLLKITN